MRTHTAPRCCQACAPEREAYLGGARTPQRGEIARRRAARRTGPGTTRPQPARLRPVAPVPPLPGWVPSQPRGEPRAREAAPQRHTRPPSPRAQRGLAWCAAASPPAPAPPRARRRLRNRPWRGRGEGARACACCAVNNLSRQSVGRAPPGGASASRRAACARARAPPLAPPACCPRPTLDSPIHPPPLPRQPPDCLGRAQRRAS